MIWLLSEDDLARSRHDAAFRQKLMVQCLEYLLDALNKMRKTGDSSPQSARQIRDGVDLAVKLADRLQQYGIEPGPRAA